MRFTSVWFLSLLLLPSLVASKQFMPSPPQPSHPPSRPSLPEHGDIVHYREHDGGTNHGLVMGTHQGSLYVAPLTHDSPPPGARRPVIPHPGRVVETLPGHVVKTEHRYSVGATNLGRHHIQNPPAILRGGGPLRGSPNRPH